MPISRGSGINPDRAELSSGDRPAAATDAGDSERRKAAGWKAISTLSADQIYDLIKDEQPQTIAIILVHLKTRVASDVICQTARMKLKQRWRYVL